MYLINKNTNRNVTHFRRSPVSDGLFHLKINIALLESFRMLECYVHDVYMQDCKFVCTISIVLRT